MPITCLGRDICRPCLFAQQRECSSAPAVVPRRRALEELQSARAFQVALSPTASHLLPTSSANPFLFCCHAGACGPIHCTTDADAGIAVIAGRLCFSDGEKTRTVTCSLCACARATAQRSMSGNAFCALQSSTEQYALSPHNLQRPCPAQEPKAADKLLEDGASTVIAGGGQGCVLASVDPAARKEAVKVCLALDNAEEGNVCTVVSSSHGSSCGSAT